jgi:hypothetical protein
MSSSLNPYPSVRQTYVAITQAIKEVQSGGAIGDRVDYNVSCIPIFSCHNVTNVVSFSSTLKNNRGESQSLLYGDLVQNVGDIRSFHENEQVPFVWIQAT